MGRTGTIYRRVRASLIDKPTNFSWVIEGRLAASGLPSSAAQIRWLSRHGVNSILTLRETQLPGDWFNGLDLSRTYVSMADHEPPSQEQLKEAADEIDSKLREGKNVLVHCLAGVGRTGCSIAAYMILYQGRSAKEAMARLRATRPGSIERNQELAIYEFERRFKPLG